MLQRLFRRKGFLIHVLADFPLGEAVVGVLPAFKSGLMAFLAGIGASVLSVDLVVRDDDRRLLRGSGLLRLICLFRIAGSEKQEEQSEGRGNQAGEGIFPKNHELAVLRAFNRTGALPSIRHEGGWHPACHRPAIRGLLCRVQEHRPDRHRAGYCRAFLFTSATISPTSSTFSNKATAK